MDEFTAYLDRVRIAVDEEAVRIQVEQEERRLANRRYAAERFREDLIREVGKEFVDQIPEEYFQDDCLVYNGHRLRTVVYHGHMNLLEWETVCNEPFVLHGEEQDWCEHRISEGRVHSAADLLRFFELSPVDRSKHKHTWQIDRRKAFDNTSHLVTLTLNPKKPLDAAVLNLHRVLSDLAECMEVEETNV